MYVRQAFGLPAVEPSATKGWENAKYKHEDYHFPNAWVPLWFSIDSIPEGHVVLRAPDGRIYSTSTPGNTPYVHPNLEHLIWYYGDRVEPEYQLTLRYLGWSEDISNVRVVESEDEMPSAVEVAQAILNFEIDSVGTEGKINLGAFLAEARLNNNKIVENTAGWLMPEVVALRELVKQLSVAQGVVIDYDAIAKAVNDDAAKRMSK
jgi:hypothetical protein